MNNFSGVGHSGIHFENKFTPGLDATNYTTFTILILEHLYHTHPKVTNTFSTLDAPQTTFIIAIVLMGGGDSA